MMVKKMKNLQLLPEPKGRHLLLLFSRYAENHFFALVVVVVFHHSYLLLLAPIHHHDVDGRKVFQMLLPLFGYLHYRYRGTSV